LLRASVRIIAAIATSQGAASRHDAPNPDAAPRVVGNCLANQDRATGMTVCETVGGGPVGIVGPLLGALILSSSGTIDPSADPFSRRGPVGAPAGC
jgi:hypothetical protein